jgi:hypothetical protein|tara:strand:+ start:26866 stop:26994 length:129 start_codon:yes stop_codon:yes gene_type:complete
MQELSLTPELTANSDPELLTLLERIDTDLRSLRSQIEKKQNP